MRIIVCIRTFNEEENIEKCCQAYPFADKILIADGGSTDGTVKIAKSFPNVKVRTYDVKVKCGGGIWRNPDGPHINFLLEWADEEKTDLIIKKDY